MKTASERRREPRRVGVAMNEPSAHAWKFISTAPDITDPAQLDAVFADLAAGFGFDRFSCVKADRAGRQKPLVLGERQFRDWDAYYWEQGLYKGDPCRLAFPLYRSSFTWSDVRRREDIGGRPLWGEAAAADMHEGLVLTLPIGQREHLVLRLTTPEKDFDQTHRTALLGLGALYATTAAQLVAEPAPPRPAVTEREAECLQWAALGKGDFEIGAILAISPHTAHRHLENAKVKLGVYTRAQAVVRAYALGIVSIA